MRFQELVIQGIRRFTSSHRYNLGSNRVWLSGGRESGKTTVAAMFRAALDYPYLTDVSSSLMPENGADASRFSLTLGGIDRRMRLSIDVATQRIALAGWNDGSGKFEGVTQDPDDIRHFLTDNYDFPDPDDWAAVYLWTVSTDPGAAGIGGDIADDFMTDDLQDVGAIQERLEELQMEKTLMASMTKVQTDADEMQSRQFELEDELRSNKEKMSRLDEIEGELARSKPLEKVDAALIEKAKDYKNLARKVLDQHNRFEEKMEKLELALQELHARGLWHKDPVFAGVAAFTLLGFIVPVAAKAYTASLLGFAGLLGGMPWAFLRTRKHLELITNTEQAVRDLEIEKKQYDREGDGGDQTKLDELVREMQVLDPSDLAQIWDERQGVLERVKDLWDELAADNVAQRSREIEEELKTIQEKVEKLNQQLLEVSSAQRNVTDIEREIDALERKLNQMTGQPDAEPTPSPSGPAEVAQSPEDRIRQVVEAGPRICMSPEDQYLSSLSQFLGKFLNAVFGDQIAKVKIGGDGRIAYHDGAKVIDPGDLPRDVSTVAAAGVAIGTAKIAARTRSFPLVWDDPFADMDDVIVDRVSRVINKAVGDLQLILLTGRKALGAPMAQPIDLG